MNIARTSHDPIETAFVLPVGFLGLLTVGVIGRTVAGQLGETGTLVLAAVMMCVLSALAERWAALPLAGLGWVAVMGFSRAPYGQLQLAQLHAVRDAVFLLVGTTVSALIGILIRNSRIDLPRLTPAGGNFDGLRASGSSKFDGLRASGSSTSTLVLVPSVFAADAPANRAGSWRGLTTALSSGRQVLGLLVAVVLLPLLTVALVPLRSELALVDELLIYLVAIVAVALIGGIVAAVLSAITASLLLNYFFTPPLHKWTIDAPQNLLALLLFVLVAVIVSATVHLAARRASLAAQSSQEAAALLALAQTVLGGDDRPAGVLDHLHATLGLDAELLERVGSGWAVIASSGTPGSEGSITVQVRDDLRLHVSGETITASRRVLDGFAAQAASALDRERLRIQAAQTETLAEGNRIRTALLAAVSHDLRTPLASVKASVSTMRQVDLILSSSDRAELLATIEEGADRLDALIGNLLDMSRLQTGSLQPFLRPTALEEVAPMTLHGLDHAEHVRLEIPEDLPLVRTDPGLLDRILANLISNALRYSPADRPPTVTAHAQEREVIVEIIDHGPGVPPEAHTKIFEAFQRLGDQRSETGVGLGLAVAKGFTEAMGGTITAVDTPGGGLTMRLLLPIAEAALDSVHPS